MSLSSNPYRFSLVAMGFVLAALAIALLGGFSGVSVWAGILAAAGVVPSAMGIVLGLREKTQGAFLVALLMLFVSLGTSVALFVVGVAGWIF
ncbi:MAG TPA: hypothetical protein VFG83_12215 [Kofleriaceae bacterium]|nr:hypothetical protein [Kofleriaceae bacterium]